MQMINLLKNSNNPQAMMQSLAAQNPTMRNVMQLINQHGGDPKAAFYALARERGVDPNSILSQLNNLK